MPKITKIEMQKRNKERVNIYIDGEYTLAVNAELVYKENLKTGEEINVEKLQIVAEKEEMLRCKDSALRIIERSYKTEKEIRDKLKDKNYNDKAIDYSIEFLKEYNFLNDNSYVKAYIKDKLSSRGSTKIRYDLMKKGISKDIIEKYLEMVDSDVERNTALELAKKKYKSIIKSESDSYRINGKLYRFLVSKGYNYDVVKDVVKKVTSSDEIFEN